MRRGVRGSCARDVVDARRSRGIDANHAEKATRIGERRLRVYSRRASVDEGAAYENKFLESPSER